jgi:hypothetical protein
MIPIYVVCEGQTEETFVRDVLWEPLGRLGLNPIGQTIETSVGKKGGALNYDRVRRHLRNQLRRQGEFYVTTLFDLYRLESNFPGMDQARSQNGLERKLEVLNEAIHADIVATAGCRPDRFISYIQPYEFEALLFSDISAVTSTESSWVRKTGILQAVRDSVESPEYINERPGNNPSAHLERELTDPKYKKTLHGPTITKRIGVTKIESECAFFAEWLNRLRKLGN